MAFWILLAIVVATTVVSVLLKPHAPGARPSALGDFQAPTAEEGRVIPVIFGTVKISAPNVVWYGDFHTYPIKVRSGLFSKTTIGYRYYLGMQLALCHGPVEGVGETLVGTATAVVTVTGTSPFAPNWWAKWTDFILPTLPEDAVIQKIYAVCRASHSVDVPANGAALATVKVGLDNGGVSVIDGNAFDGLGFNQGKAIVTNTAEYDGLFYIDTGEDTLEWIETMAMGASMGQSLFQFSIHDVLLVTGLGFAVYYTSATPSNDSSDLPAPVEIPEGQGVAWSYPEAVEVFVPPPEDHRGTVEATAGISIEFGSFGLSAGQVPDDIPVPHTILSVTPDIIWILMSAPGLFGGDDRLPTSEGGLNGGLAIYRGTQTQESDDYLNAQFGFTVPQYRGLCHAVARGCYFGKSQVLKNLNFVLRRFPSNLGLPRSVTYIAGDANPAEQIYEAMTNPLWGLGRPTERFDLGSWQAAAITLASEGMGMSLQWDRDAEADELIGDILRHIDGVLQTDPETGLWTIKLIRPQAPELELTEDDLLEAPEFTRGSWEETWNEVVLTYTDGDTFKPRTVSAQDSANQRVVGAVDSQSLEFLGFTKPGIAQQVAMRELKTHSYPFAKVQIKAKRKAWPLRVGSPFTIAWAPTGITSIQLRVLNIDYGQLEKGMIEIDAVEDAFAVAYSAFDAPQDSAWIDPIGDPEPPDAQWIQESPVEWLLAPMAEERVVVGAVRGDDTSRGYQIQADEGDGYFHSNTADKFAPSGLLTANYLRTTAALHAAGFTLGTAQDLSAVGGTDAAGRARGDCLVVFEDTGEICAFQGVTDNEDGSWTFTNVARGVYDTLPADHAAGVRVFIIRDVGTWFLFPYRADTAEDTDAGGDQFIVIED